MKSCIVEKQSPVVLMNFGVCSASIVEVSGDDLPVSYNIFFETSENSKHCRLLDVDPGKFESSF